ncbi:hypothetical protein COU97_00125 [Candidatus Shapirobacteria bacterium CG10_big_fil_rev_8_21_14_0_10_48_15]|uniref:Uncharacterized protein n=1 Tax=Candidatus Shapirobacteria bacterium CG10_big_fil_rev_8_21_14_0_10_48_15 TaxID=1974484 RepID=A0A2M8L7Y8_9BACT|nr:MAG: hypothetical protein COU97_00125 [Candidatus Shapirobacteria bacterium CG10_big_fil_rev_8_21_14_0_10_48_15]
MMISAKRKLANWYRMLANKAFFSSPKNSRAKPNKKMPDNQKLSKQTILKVVAKLRPTPKKRLPKK